jgi:hypothetical protein
MNFSTMLRAALGSFAMLVLAQTAFGEMHATTEFESGANRPVTIALLPAQVELVKQRMIRREAQVEEAGGLEKALTDAVAAELGKKGYAVRVIMADDINADAELQALVVEANRRFDEVLTNISARLSKNIETRRYQVGDTITVLAKRLDVHAVAFVRMQLIAAAKGVQILNMGMAGAQTMVSISLVDVNTTDIEAYVTLPVLRRGKVFGGYEDVMNDPEEEMAKYAEATLSDLLDADPGARAAQPDDNVISDIEQILK